MTEHDAFDAMMEAVDPAVYVVTTAARGERSGCLVGFATQMSIDPLRFLVGISQVNHTHRVAADADCLAVHVVDRAHRDLIRLFAGETGDEIDKFEHCDWTDGPYGLPILSGAGIWFAGRILDRVDVGGDHTCYVLEPVAGRVLDAHVPRGNWARAADAGDVEPGHPS
ncbi:flavin reductase family protein [Gordonia hydrophobica]|uniref:Flavin reductase family protein n=1 Tax=Gordonia hydrophobica TaxID=40516 RepID=A0ABZ2TYM8_9ACTN|nr:flavin reductase family protein [Gordonia hydrophobica]MBM7365815.1 flavin reductase (DIM6/NTAB) family NADH-FMN oxidoreductase RutF [Gordonia hydrophobica]